VIIRAIIKTAVLPPAASLLLALVSLIIWRRWPKVARMSLALSLLSLWLLSTPVISHALMERLERHYRPLNFETIPDAVNAVVILGGGRRATAQEYGADTVNSRTLVRLRFGAEIHRRTQLPLLVSGGRVYGDETVAEAQLMARVLRDEFSVPVKWLEVNSRTTAENAYLSAELLKQQHIDSILLVTHAWHMRRAVWVFEQAGLKVTPAAMGYSSGGDIGGMSFLPSAHALLTSHYALHEMLGGWVYRWTESNSAVRTAPL